MEDGLEIKVRAAYVDTDQMGFVHHSNYVKYLEYARWEWFRFMGLPYKTIEENGILMPVVDMQLHFVKPIYYDDLISIDLEVKLVGAARLKFDYGLYNEHGQLLHSAQTILAFVKKSTKRPCRVPDAISSLLSQFDLKNQCL